jgi:DNA-binding transcriptional LysR family regulator
MKFPALLAFIDLAATGNFRTTARRLQLSPSALSTQIRALEDDLGTLLVVRDRRGCTLTPAGAQALPLARSLTDLAGRLQTLFREPRLTIAASSNIGTYLLPALCRRFHEDTALLSDLTVAGNPECAERVRDGRVDCAVLEWWTDMPGFSAVVWHREPLVAIAPPDHPWTRHEHLLAADLMKEPLLGGESGSGTGTVLRKALGERANRLRVSMRLGSTEAVKQAVMNGLGVSVVMASAVRTEVAAGRLWAAPVADAPLHKDLHAVCRQDWQPNHAPRIFQNFLSMNGRV